MSTSLVLHVAHALSTVVFRLRHRAELGEDLVSLIESLQDIAGALYQLDMTGQDAAEQALRVIVPIGIPTEREMRQTLSRPACPSPDQCHGAPAGAQDA